MRMLLKMKVQRTRAGPPNINRPITDEEKTVADSGGGSGGSGLEEKLLQESSTVLSEPKFGLPLSIKNSWIRRQKSMCCRCK